MNQEQILRFLCKEYLHLRLEEGEIAGDWHANLDSEEYFQDIVDTLADQILEECPTAKLERLILCQVLEDLLREIAREKNERNLPMVRH